MQIARLLSSIKFMESKEKGEQEMKRIVNMKHSVECLGCNYRVVGDGVAFCDLCPGTAHFDNDGTGTLRHCKDREGKVRAAALAPPA